jgi:hypothetical protein
VDTYGALILTPLIVGLPIIIWVMIGFFETARPGVREMQKRWRRDPEIGAARWLLQAC